MAKQKLNGENFPTPPCEVVNLQWTADADTEYDLALLDQLNEEYADRPVVPHPPERTDRGYAKEAESCLRFVPPWVKLENRSLLEIGCGSGHFGAVAAQRVSQYAGVDIAPHPKWEEISQQYPNCEFRVVDLSRTVPFEEKSFDVIVSWVVWEHLERPYVMLDVAQRLLKPGGYMVLFANVYTSAIASHLYRDVFFPWPHLLFPECVLREYVRERWRRTGQSSAAARAEEQMPEACLYVNRVSLSQYLEYFRRTRWRLAGLKKIVRPLDQEFLHRFHYVLSRFPEEDLELDFFIAVLRAPGGAPNLRTLRKTFQRSTQKVKSVISPFRRAER